eukprot:scaffold12089_cov176-Ochromonas_danica.AAC.14
MKNQSRTAAPQPTGPVQSGALSLDFLPQIDESTHSAEPPEPVDDIRALIAAVVVKLSSVLSSDWSMQKFPFGDDTLLGASGGGMPSYEQKGRFRAQSKANKVTSLETALTASADANSTLNALINIVSTIVEASLVNTRVTSHDSGAQESFFNPTRQSTISTMASPLCRPTTVDGNSRDAVMSSLEGPLKDLQQKTSFASMVMDTEAFLLKYFNLSLEDFVAGRIEKARNPVDRAAVLCSSALATLAEVVQCRPGLVARGVLGMIKAWLEVGCVVFENIRSLLLYDLRPEQDNVIFQASFMTLFTPTFDLLSNICAAFVSITGGTDGRFRSIPCSISTQLGGGRDYIVGWIDAQILAEGLPDVLVRLILSGHEPFLRIEDLKQSTHSVLPAIIGMYTSQILFQLCSRTQNRHRLQGNAIPFACCMIFEATAGQVKHSVTQECEEDSVALSSVSIFRVIFEYGGIALSPRVVLSEELQAEETFLTTSFAMKPPSLKPANNPNSRWEKAISPVSTCFAVIAAITASCLDTITFYLVDETTKSNSLFKSNSLNSSPFSIPNMSLVNLMSSPRVVEAISMATSFLPKGLGRLSCARLIYSLTENPSSLKALYEGSVMDVLVWISSESEEAQRSASVSTKEAAIPANIDGGVGEREDGLSIISVLFPSRKLGLERGVSNHSTVSGMTSSVRSRSHSEHRLAHPQLSPSQGMDDSYTRYLQGVEEETKEEEWEKQEEQNMATEETLTVCYALANLCEAGSQYALRMADNGLFTIMTRIVTSENVETKHQALRCMYAMCQAMAWCTNNTFLTAEERRQPAKKEDISSAYEVLIANIKCMSVPAQRVAIATLSQLALISSEIKDRIVEECLRTLVSMLVDRRNDRDVRNACEEVLKSLGFTSGTKDLETCGFDFEILKDWYTIQRSLKPQEEALEQLRDWISRLFLVEEYDNNDMELQRSNHLHRHNLSLLQNGYANKDNSESEVYHLIDEAAAILHTEIVHSDRPGYLRENTGGAAQSSSSGLSLSLPQLQRHFTDGLLKFLPFCSPKALFQDLSQHSDVDGKGSVSMRSSSKDFQSMSLSMHRAPAASSSSYRAWDGYRWIDRPPIGVTYLLDLFYTSKMHQWLLTDLTSLGVCFPVGFGAASGMIDRDCEDELRLSFIIPHPHPIYAVLLPTRSYQTFARVGRMLQRLFDTCAAPSPPSSAPHNSGSQSRQLWALCFNESDFHGDFHTTLLTTLQRCPQICSLSFSSSRCMEEDALLGHLVGQLPSNIRFVSFKSTLSKESVQALCIMLRNHNEAFMPPVDFEGELPRSASKSVKASPSTSYRDNSGKNMNKGLLGLALTHMTFEGSELEHIISLLQPPPLPRPPSFAFVKAGGTPASEKLKADPSSTPNSRPTSEKSVFVGGSYFTSPRSSFTATPVAAPQPMSASPAGHRESVRGLRYLDLSHNRLSDTQCAIILLAAISGPLEGLELGGNWIYRGTNFINAMDSFSAEKFAVKPNRLRYLGLSQNNLTHRALSSILHKLFSNTSLTSLDLSANGIESNVSNNELLRCFMKRNQGLRVLDLSYNKLSAESFKEIELGLLENHTLLLMPLAGNGSDFSKTIELIQTKLRNNRLFYKARSSEGFVREDNSVYHTEDVSSRISLSEPEELALHMLDLPVATAEAVAAQISAASVCAGVEDSAKSHASDNITKPSADDSSLKDMSDERGLLNSKEKNSDALAKTTLSSDGPTAMSEGADDTTATPNSKGANGLGQGRTRAEEVACAVARPVVVLPPAEPKPVPRDRPESKPEARADSSEVVQTTAITPRSSNSSLGATLKRESSLSGMRSYAVNTLHVLFSVPLVGFDRSAKAHPLEVLDYSSERDTLIQVFKEVHRDVAVHFDFATTDRLRTMLSFGCRALHFSGHGLPYGLCFEDGRSGLQVIKAQQLKDLLGAGGLALEFVFVSACYSKEIGAAFVNAGVPHVVCVKVDSKIQDAAAIAFTRAFYVALLSGKTVAASFAIAKEALKVSPYVPNSVLEGEKFILLPEAHDLPAATSSVDGSEKSSAADRTRLLHGKTIFQSRVVSEWPERGQCTIGPNRTDVDTFLCRNRLPTPPADFEGREVIMNTLIRHILDRRLVSLVGEDGMGKSAVAAAVCNYLYDHEVFEHSIVFIRAKGVSDFASFLKAMKASLMNFGCQALQVKLEELQQQQRQSSAEAGGMRSVGVTKGSLLHEEELLLLRCLESMKILLVLDNLDELLSDYGDNVTDLRLFLTRLFEQCSYLKILHVSVDTLGMHNITVGSGIVEYSVNLGPLSLSSTLRLFARLAPSLSTAQEKASFIESLLPPKQYHSSVASQILTLFGQGNPSKIVHMACQSNVESVRVLKETGFEILREFQPMLHGISPASSSVYQHNNDYASPMKKLDQARLGYCLLCCFDRTRGLFRVAHHDALNELLNIKESSDVQPFLPDIQIWNSGGELDSDKKMSEESMAEDPQATSGLSDADVEEVFDAFLSSSSTNSTTLSSQQVFQHYRRFVPLITEEEVQRGYERFVKDFCEGKEDVDLRTFRLALQRFSQERKLDEAVNEIGKLCVEMAGDDPAVFSKMLGLPAAIDSAEILDLMALLRR